MLETKLKKGRIPRVDRPRVKLFLEMVDTSLKSVAVRSLFSCVHSLNFYVFTKRNVIRFRYTTQFQCVTEKEIYGEQSTILFWSCEVLSSILIVGFFQACLLPSWNTFFFRLRIQQNFFLRIFTNPTTLFGILIRARFTGWRNNIKAYTICFEIRWNGNLFLI